MSVTIASALSVVALESNLTWEFNLINVVSGSTISGVIDAIVYGFKSFTNCVFWVEVKFAPVVDFTEIKTLPYSGVDDTPVDGSKEPSSPPKTETACVFGKSCLTKVS